MTDKENNTGDWNSGNRNSGNWNSGYGNSGNWNSCDGETGYFNTENPDTIRVFNKACDKKTWQEAEKPRFLFFDLTTWVSGEDMTDQEKKDDPEFTLRGGQLQTKDYKEAWREAYDSATKEEIRLLKSLPNFDADVFEEITGVRVDEEKQTCTGKIVEIDGIKYKLTEVK